VPQLEKGLNKLLKYEMVSSRPFGRLVEGAKLGALRPSPPTLSQREREKDFKNEIYRTSEAKLTPLEFTIYLSHLTIQS